jgi:uncharacterized DUF497 family protein
MSALRFEWDARKAAANLEKHAVSFEEAKSVFYDERGKLIDDPDRSEHEERFILLGLSSGMKRLVVAHCYRGDSEIVRIFSARKATKEEADFYW